LTEGGLSPRGAVPVAERRIDGSVFNRRRLDIDRFQAEFLEDGGDDAALVVEGVGAEVGENLVGGDDVERRVVVAQARVEGKV
jgi:hypothetical protein